MTIGIKSSNQIVIRSVTLIEGLQTYSHLYMLEWKMNQNSSLSLRRVLHGLKSDKNRERRHLQSM